MPRPHWQMSKWWAPMSVIEPPEYSRYARHAGKWLWTPRGLSTRVVGTHRGLSEPRGPIQPWLHLLLGQIAPAARSADADLDRADLAQPPAADELDGPAKRAEDAGSLLAAGLHHAVVFTYGIDAKLGLGDRQRQRFLAIDVLTGLAGFDDRDRVPMVGGGDHHGIDVVAADDLAEIVGIVATLVRLLLLPAVGVFHPFLGVHPPRRVDLAYGQGLDVAEPQQRRQGGSR